MIVAGWADGYTNIAFRGFEALACPKRVILGPWGHGSTGDRAARAAHRPRPGADPLVPPLARRRARTASTRSRRSRSSRAARPAPRPTSPRCAASGAASRPGLRSGSPSGCSGPTGEGTDVIHVRGDVGRPAWISCAGRLPWGLPGRPALRRRALAHLRLGAARRRARRDGTPARAAHRHLARAGRLPLGQALRRLPRRHVRPRLPRPAQPHPPRRPRRAGRARARRADARSRSSSRRPRGSSSRATGCGSRSRGPTGRTSGRRRAARRSRSSAASVELVLPVLDGPAAAAAARRCRRRPARTRTRPTPTSEQPPVVWRFEDDQIGHETRAVTRYGSSYEAPFGARVEERYEGTVGVSKDDPARRLGARARRLPHHLARGRRAHRGDARGALGRRRRTTSSSSSSPRSSGRRRKTRLLPRAAVRAHVPAPARVSAHTAAAVTSVQQDAGRPMPGAGTCHLPQLRIDLPAPILGHRAAGVEAAAGRHVHRVRRLAREDLRRRLLIRVAPGHDRDQRLRVRVLRVADNVSAQAPPRRSGRGTSRRSGRRSAPRSRGRA